MAEMRDLDMIRLVAVEICNLGAIGLMVVEIYNSDTIGLIVAGICNSGTIRLMVVEICNSGTTGLRVAEMCNSGTVGLMVAEVCNSGTIGLMVVKICNSSTIVLMVAEICNSGTVGLIVAEVCNLGTIGLMVVEICNSGTIGLIVAEMCNSSTIGLMVVEIYNSGANVSTWRGHVGLGDWALRLHDCGLHAPDTLGFRLSWFARTKICTSDYRVVSGSSSSGIPSSVDAKSLKDLEVMKSCHNVVSVINEEALGSIRECYSILDEYALWAPLPEQRPYNPGPSEISISVDVLEAGLRFPLHPTIVECLRWWRISPSQMTPNSWRYLIAFLGECRGAGIIPT
ncbi:hypothetical protein GW17_00018096 [Ensete ventricosum]|nr:hypothetical protein GW17_00018096 [Ensete ventricosum]